MKKVIDITALKFCSTVLSVGENLSSESLLYWARNSEKLKELLEKKDFELITRQAISDISSLPNIAATTRKELGYASFLKNDVYNFIDNIPEKYPETSQVNVFPFRLNVRLHLRELFEEMGERDALYNSAFTYPQIHWLATHENNRKSNLGILDFDQSNYLLVKLVNENVGLLHLISREVNLHHKCWRVWLNDHDEILLNEGKLLLTESY